MIIIKSKAEVHKMQRAGRLVAQAHALIRDAIAPGITTEALDQLVADFFAKQGAESSFLGYQGYPAHICTSVNEEVVHGIPDAKVLEEGDIVAVDIGAHVDGFHGDSAWTYTVGDVPEETQRLLQVTEEALFKGIEKAVVGGRLSDISHAIQMHAEAAGFSIVREFVGHGIGRDMHEAPQIPNYGSPGRGPRLRAGMTLAIEPMVNAGSPAVKILDDGWTVVTIDTKMSAHFEHTVAVTDDGPVILTLDN